MEDFRRHYFYYEKKVFGTVNEYWAAAIKFVRAKEFFAELLGTFVLVVSSTEVQCGINCLPLTL